MKILLGDFLFIHMAAFHALETREVKSKIYARRYTSSICLGSVVNDKEYRSARFFWSIRSQNSVKAKSHKCVKRHLINGFIDVYGWS